MSTLKSRDGLTFLNLDAKQQVKSVSKESTIENQINKGMQNVIHEYLVKTWGEYYMDINTDAFGVDKKKTNGDTVHTNNDTPLSFEGWAVVLPTNNGTTVKGQKVGRCFRLGTQQTYLQGVKTRACCYYTVNGKTYYYNDKGEVITDKK
jgi:hypothetical protein|tara:strand:- start:88 stop:534 length:447 start_codon:yes stop_codon:yes gene_type:complete